MRGHYQSNELGEREFVRYEPAEDEAYERLLDDIAIQDAIDRAQRAGFIDRVVSIAERHDEEVA